MDGSRAEGPFFSNVPLFEHRQRPVAVHQHPVTSGGVEVRNSVQAAVDVAETSHKREHEARRLSSSENQMGSRVDCVVEDTREYFHNNASTNAPKHCI